MTKKIITRYASFFFGILFIALNLISIKVEASSTQIRGRSTVAQTVYTGPSSSNYEVMGSIDANEEIYILGKEKGLNWYHIQYHAGSKQKSGYVPISTITSITGGTPNEEEFYGGYAVSNTAQTVWSCDNPSIAVSIGSIGVNEGVTRLYAYDNVMLIEYSTSGKAKRGYVYNPNFSYPISTTCAARVTSSSTLTYGCKSGYSWGTAGSVDAGEYVAVLAGSAGRNIVYVEYNTSSGRKRGYMPASKLAFHGGVTVASLDDMYGIPGGTEVGAYPLAPVSGKTAVYAGPGTSYAKVGYIMPETTYGFDGEITINGNHWTYIIYKENGVMVSGFID